MTAKGKTNETNKTVHEDPISGFYGGGSGDKLSGHAVGFLEFRMYFAWELVLTSTHKYISAKALITNERFPTVNSDAKLCSPIYRVKLYVTFDVLTLVTVEHAVSLVMMLCSTVGIIVLRLCSTLTAVTAHVTYRRSDQARTARSK